MAVKVKVVFQGGGANLVSLMAAASVLEDLRSEKFIEITKLVGVSAGAITACMLASDTRLETYRSRIKDIGPRFIPHFRLNTQSKPSQVKLLYKIINGKPLFNEQKLNEFFNAIFVDHESKVDSFDKLEIPTSIIASNLLKREKIVYGPNDVAGKSIMQVLVDSCALPYAFRTHQNGEIVDGGVVNNFPIDELISHEDDSFLLGFGFDSETPVASRNPLEFGLSLLSTSIDSTVKENASRIQLMGGEICLLRKAYGVIEFDKALTEGLQLSRFREIKKAIRHDLETAVHRLADQAIIQEDASDVRNKVLKIYKSLDRHQKKSREVVSVVYADSLCNTLEKDKWVTTIKIKPENETLQVFATGLAAATEPIVRGESDWRVENENGSTIKATQILAPDRRNISGSSEVMHRAMFFLDEPFKKGNGSLKLIQESKSRFFKPLEEHGVDFIRHQCLPPHFSSKVVQILLVPKEYDDLTLYDLKSNLDVLVSLGLMDADYADNIKGSWKTGKRLSESEANDYMGNVSHVSYKRYCWETVDVDAGHFCGFVVGRNGSLHSGKLV